MMHEIIENKEIGESYIHFRHKSGLDVYASNKNFSVVCAYISVCFGSLDSEFKSNGSEIVKLPCGVAHFLEHKMFENEDGTDALSDFAAYGGNANAYTTTNYTSYYFSCTENFEENLRILLRLVFTSHFTEENVKKEQGIIAEEIKMYEDLPSSVMHSKLIGLLYPKHPVKESICGTVKSISAITPSILQNCFDNFYTPSNMKLCICGDFSLEVLERILDENVTSEKNTAVFCKKAYDMTSSSKHITESEMNISLPMCMLGIKDSYANSNFHDKLKRSCVFDIVCDLLFGKSSSGYNTLRDNGVIFGGIESDYEFGADYSHLLLAFTAENPQNAADNIKNIILEAKSFPPYEKDFIRIKNAYYSDYIRAFDSTEEIAENFAYHSVIGADLFDIFKMIRSITYNDVTEALRSVTEENIYLSIINPKGENNA